MRGLAYITPKYREAFEAALFAGFIENRGEISAPGVYEYIKSLAGKTIVMSGTGRGKEVLADLTGSFGCVGQVLVLSYPIGLCAVIVSTTTVNLFDDESGLYSVTPKTVMLFATFDNPDVLIAKSGE